MKRTTLSAILILLVWPIKGQDMDLFSFWEYYSDAENAMYKTSCDLAFQQLANRKSRLESLSSESDYLERQALVKEKLHKILGELPTKTPLNAKVTGTIIKDDFKVEKILFESMPGYYVTAALFLPVKGIGKYPVVIYASGHTENGFRSQTYQHVIINLVKKGFAVFAFDPIGQGERWQYLNEDGSHRFRSPTIEHSYPGAQCYVAGYSPTKYFVWDAIRGIDYLLTRKEIDPQRIGMTGRSGGGTQTAYAAAIDDRILAAAPEAFITKMEYILKSIGPQDAEQNLYHMIAEGLDHADLLEVRAPKPCLMITTTNDFFSIQGARDTFLESKRFYQGMGAPDAISMVEDDAGHQSTKRNREAMYAFFQKYLNNPGSYEDQEVELFKEEELWVTSTGNTGTSVNSESLYSLNRSLVKDKIKNLNEAREQRDNDTFALSDVITKISGLNQPEQFPSSVFSGRIQIDEQVIEKYLLPGSGNYQIPMAAIEPQSGPGAGTVLILHELGLVQASKDFELVKHLNQQGYRVVLADLPGIGSLGPGYLKGDAYVDNTSFNQWFAGILTGKSIVAMRAEDIIRVVNFICSENDESQQVYTISVGALASELLHAAHVEPRISSVAMVKPFVSYAAIAMAPDYQPSFITSVVAGAINEYDLPDLMGSVCPRKVLIINPVDALGKEYTKEAVTSLLGYPYQVFQDRGSAESFQVLTNLTDNQLLTGLAEWFQ